MERKDGKNRIEARKLNINDKRKNSFIERENRAFLSEKESKRRENDDTI